MLGSKLLDIVSPSGSAGDLSLRGLKDALLATDVTASGNPEKQQPQRQQPLRYTMSFRGRSGAGRDEGWQRLSVKTAVGGLAGGGGGGSGGSPQLLQRASSMREGIGRRPAASQPAASAAAAAVPAGTPKTSTPQRIVGRSSVREGRSHHNSRDSVFAEQQQQQQPLTPTLQQLQKRQPHVPPPLIEAKSAVQFWRSSGRDPSSAGSGGSGGVGGGGGGGCRSPRSTEAEVSVEHFKFDLYQNAEAEAARSLGDAGAASTVEKACGLVNIRIGYNFDRACLQVDLRHAKDLCLPSPASTPDSPAGAGISKTSERSSDQPGRLPSPFARLQLLPQKEQQQVSRVQKLTNCPIWNEKFNFSLEFRQCQSVTLEVELRSHSKRGGSRLIGKARIPLSSVNVQGGETVNRPVYPCGQERDDIGDILLSLHYLPNAKRLNMDVLRVRNLLHDDMTKRLEPLIKVTFHDGKKVVKTKKTGKRNSLTGEFRDTFRLDIGEAELEQLTISISVFSQPRFKESLVGQVSLGRASTGAEEGALWRRLLLSARQSGASESVGAWLPLKPKNHRDSSSSQSSQ